MSIHSRRWPATPLWQYAYDLERDAELLRLRHYGVIEIHNGELERIVLRPWPKLTVMPEVWWLGGKYDAKDAGDRCRLYYNQPRHLPQFLTLYYVLSSPKATFATTRRAAQVLDAIAAIKRSDAIVCEARNLRISERLLHRWGWERHCWQSRRRHYIKRFSS